jgi:ABC-type nitrate/sulfonate/bicarbonate transport system substrate-binding protein
VLAAGQLFRPQDSKSFALVVSADSSYRSAKDLNGKKIGVNAPVSIVGVGARAWIDRDGGDSSTIELLQVPFGTAGEALQMGRADAVSTVFTELAGLKNIRVLGYPTEAVAPSFIGSGRYVRRDWIAANRALAQRYQRALVEANEHQNSSGQILIKDLHLTPEGVQSLRGHRVVYAERLDPKLMQPIIAVAMRYGIIPKPFQARDMVADLA